MNPVLENPWILIIIKLKRLSVFLNLGTNFVLGIFRNWSANILENLKEKSNSIMKGISSSCYFFPKNIASTSDERIETTRYLIATWTDPIVKFFDKYPGNDPEFLAILLSVKFTNKEKHKKAMVKKICWSNNICLIFSYEYIPKILPNSIVKFFAGNKIINLD